MAKSTFQANDFNLTGHDTTISFATTSFTGRATFGYKTGQTDLKFSGDAVRSVGGEFGKLVTVTIGGEGDGGDSTLTLLMPTVSLASPEETVGFDTIAILTALRRLGPAHQRYKVLNLHGTARLTVF